MRREPRSQIEVHVLGGRTSGARALDCPLCACNATTHHHHETTTKVHQMTIAGTRPRRCQMLSCAKLTARRRGLGMPWPSFTCRQPLRSATCDVSHVAGCGYLLLGVEPGSSSELAVLRLLGFPVGDVCGAPEAGWKRCPHGAKLSKTGPRKTPSQSSQSCLTRGGP